VNFWLGDRDRAIEIAATGWEVCLRGLGCWVDMLGFSVVVAEGFEGLEAEAEGGDSKSGIWVEPIDK
jgi:hypothetical protein